MSAITTWKCPQDGIESPLTVRKCPVCGWANMPRCVSLQSEATGKAADIAGTTKLGRAVFTQRFADPEAKYASDEQFEIVRDEVVVAWMVRPVAGALNATFYNGTEVPPTGCELTEGGVISIGRSRMKLTVKFK